MTRSTLAALARFFGGSAVRVAIRSSALGLILTFFWIGTATPNILYELRQFAFSVATPKAGPGAIYLFATLGLGLAAQGVHRFRVGLHGWLRSLPADALTVRRAIWIGLSWAQLPLMIAYAVVMLTAATVYRSSIAPAKLVGMAVAFVAAGAVAGSVVCETRWRRIAVGVLAVGALLLAAAARWETVAAAAALLALSDRAAGGVRAPARVARRRIIRPTSPTWMAVWIAWRALGTAVIRSALAGAVPLVAVGFFLANNEDLAPSTAALALRMGAGLALAIYLASLATALAARRPPWRWVRSLPWSSARRVAADVIALGLPGVALVLPAVVVDPGPGILAALQAPVMACIAAGALRRADDRRPSGATGETLRYGVPLAVAWGIWPASLVAAPLVAVIALRVAVRRERDRVVSEWEELHHRAAGDGMIAAL